MKPEVNLLIGVRLEAQIKILFFIVVVILVL